MFEDVLEEARGDLAGNDWNDWDQLSADKVMDTIQKVLNSYKDLSFDESMDISVGSIDLQKGGAKQTRHMSSTDVFFIAV
jgi:hypothetical protein